jgi:hypothetical protein
MEEEFSKMQNKALANKIMENIKNLLTTPQVQENINLNLFSSGDNINQNENINPNNQPNIENPPDINNIKIPADKSEIEPNTTLNNFLNNEENINLNNTNNTYLGRKIRRDPGEFAKEFAVKHTLGNIKCHDIDLISEKYNDDIQMIMKYAESVHPFKLVIEFCQKFKWPSPEIDTFSIAKDEKFPMFKTTISVKNNTFRGEATGAQKKVSKSKQKK